MQYLPRVLDRVLATRLRGFGAVLIEGPKWCGKTTTAAQIAKSILRLQDPATKKGYLAAADADPSLLLQGATPRLIDEWQDIPEIWDAVRIAVDDRNSAGQFILTGSNNIDRDQIAHTGIGRITRLKMIPMSLWESQESNGKISLQQLFDEPQLDINGIASEMKIEDLIFAACRGGWPASLNKPADVQLLIAQDLVNSIVQDDMTKRNGISPNPALTSAILKSYARNISTLAKHTTILQDVISSANLTASSGTVEKHITALKKLFIIDDLPAWGPKLRSKTAIRRGQKRAFCDPSIAVAALGATPQSLIEQFDVFGFIFEQLCIRDLKAYTPDFQSHLSYYHDRYDLEADLVLHLADGRYALIECKLGSHELDKGAQHLLKIKNLVQRYNQNHRSSPLRTPDLLIILSGGPVAFTRPDGVKVIPLATLRP